MTSSEPTPWDAFVATHTIGDTVDVTVTRTLPFGCLIEASHGIPGLLKSTGPQTGDRVQARIETIDPANHRISVTAA
jgi:ribosomal protein S1